MNEYDSETAWTSSENYSFFDQVRTNKKKLLFHFKKKTNEQKVEYSFK